MAVAPALSPSTTLSPATDLSPGQGNHPLLWVQYSTDEASDTDPLWQDATAKVRGFNTNRGRNSELDEVDAGTATITLDNRDRTFDPTVDATIRPMNRWRIWGQPQGSNTTESIFVGYAESYDQQWPGGGKDAIAVVSLADEFKVLALDRLPVMNPPRDTYADVVTHDNPMAYWRMDNAEVTETATASIGDNLVVTPGGGSFAFSTFTPIIGDDAGYNSLVNGAFLSVEPQQGRSGDVTGLAEFSVELWFRWDTNPASNRDIVAGPSANSLSTYVLKLLTTGAIQIEARNSAGTNFTIASGILSVNTWYHIVATITSSTLRLYVNGTQVNSTAWTPSFHASLTAAAVFQIGTSSSAEDFDFDEVAVYRHGLGATRVAAHYTAGASRGFAKGQESGVRAAAVLDSVTSLAPRSLEEGTRLMSPAFMRGQQPLDELRQVARAEFPTGLLFVARTGTVVLLANDHRSASPYNTVQATFDDDGTDLPYTDVDVDYFESFLFNEFNVSAVRGTLQTASDTTSITRYFKRSQTITDLPVVDPAGGEYEPGDTTAATIAAAMLAKYKDPFTRITSLVITTTDPDAAEATLALDIGARIRVFRTPPGVGARIDQTLFVQKISVAGDANSPVWRITLGVSPL